jgi:16S rRNA (uracil1498-N3)-methyltransferase
MQLFYNPSIDKNTHEITFDKIESRHVIKVLRKKEGDHIYLTNGKGDLFHCKISIANDKKCLISVVNIEQKKQHRKYYLHLAIAPTKNNDRLEWFLEKATEIGIDEITPIICDNSERKFIKLERLKKIIISAMKQSLKFHLPKLNEVVTLSEFLKHNQTQGKYIAHCVENEKQLMKDVLLPQESSTILIGPEGDFSFSEIEKSLQKGYTPITLGEARLRTETAALVSVMNVSFINQ